MTKLGAQKVEEVDFAFAGRLAEPQDLIAAAIHGHRQRVGA